MYIHIYILFEIYLIILKGVMEVRVEEPLGGPEYTFTKSTTETICQNKLIVSKRTNTNIKLCTDTIYTFYY